MRRETILMIWIGGFVLAVALYLIGPDRFLDACSDLIDRIDAAFRNLVAALGAQAYGAVRAAAIALYVVFVVLALLASQRGHRGIGALMVVTVVFLGWSGGRTTAFPPRSAAGSRFGAGPRRRRGHDATSDRAATSPRSPPPPYPPGGRAP